MYVYIAGHILHVHRNTQKNYIYRYIFSNTVKAKLIFNLCGLHNDNYLI